MLATLSISEKKSRPSPNTESKFKYIQIKLILLGISKGNKQKTQCTNGKNREKRKDSK
jgi:hypothetical protein